MHMYEIYRVESTVMARARSVLASLSDFGLVSSSILIQESTVKDHKPIIQANPRPLTNPI